MNLSWYSSLVEGFLDILQIHLKFKQATQRFTAGCRTISLYIQHAVQEKR